MRLEGTWVESYCVLQLFFRRVTVSTSGTDPNSTKYHKVLAYVKHRRTLLRPVSDGSREPAENDQDISREDQKRPSNIADLAPPGIMLLARNQDVGVREHTLARLHPVIVHHGPERRTTRIVSCRISPTSLHLLPECISLSEDSVTRRQRS